MLIQSLFTACRHSLRSCGLASGFVAAAAAADWRSLTEHSPFVPAEKVLLAEELASDPALDHLELAGVVVIGGRARASLYDRAEGFAFWAAEGEEFGGVRLERCDPETDSVVVATATARRHLVLRGEGETNGSVVIAGRRPGERRSIEEVQADHLDVVAAITTVTFAQHRTGR
jgi:hypothetical protein